MKLSISKKFAKRSIKCLALFAPLAYLFGSLFFGLNGAHGDSGFSADYELITSYDEYTNNQLFDGSSSNSFSLLQVNISSVDGIFSFSGTASGSGGRLNDLFSVRPRLEANHRYYVATNTVFDGGFYLSKVDDYSVVYGLYGLSGSFVSTVNQTVIVGVNFLQGVSYNMSSVWFNLIDLTLWFNGDIPTDYASQLPSLPIAYDLGTHIELPVYSQADYTDFIFNQFFQKDNFLSQWGRNAISENPVGFAPFGAFFKLLDDNIFHLSNSQVGLMAYGYLYYCLHVLIACLAFDIVAFIPLFVQRVQDKLGGKDDD